jgi:hypothetical protein
MKPHNKAYGRDLEFICRINADGTTKPVEKEQSYLSDTLLTLSTLSISADTYIAHGFSSYVVKMKPTAHTPRNNWELSEALKAGTTCRVNRKHVKAVFEALDYYTLKADIEVNGDTVTIIPKP